jgi:hypothetical protein
MKLKKPGYSTSIILAVFLGLGVLLTLMPNPGAYKVNLMGYSSFCTFTPISTLACIFAGAINCTLRKRFLTTTIKTQPTA